MPLRIGLLGASRIAPKAILAPARERDDVQVTAVAARDHARAQAFAEAHGIGAAAEDYASLVGRDDVDVVYNALPPSGHLEWTVAALEAGKAVLCEKPFARNAAEAGIMADAARRTGRLLIEAFHYRHHHVMHEAVSLVRSGVLGRLQQAQGVFQVPIKRTDTELRWRGDLGGGGLMDLGCYPLHALRTLTGAEPVVRSARATWDGDVDAELQAELEFDGVPARIVTSMISEHPVARLELQGEHGRIEITNFVAPQIGSTFTVELNEQLQQRPTEGPSTYAAQMQHLVDAYAGRAQPLPSLDDAVANMSAIDAIYQAAGRPPQSARR